MSTATTKSSSLTPTAPPGPVGLADGGGDCYHCGLVCQDDRYTFEERSFCCQGCLTVFELLTANGLENFYELGKSSGLKFSRPKPAEQYSYLDEPGVRNAFVNFTDESVTRVTFRVPEIHCIACVWLLENLGRINEGISTAQVNFPRKEITIQFNNDQLKLSEVVALLVSLGYPPELKLSDLAGGKSTSVSKRLWLQVGIAGFAFSNIMLFSLPGYFGLDQFSGPMFNRLFGWFSLILVLPVLIYSAQDYWRSAWAGLRQRRLAIEVPVSLGLAALFLRSTHEVLSGIGPGYFDSLTGLVFFLLIGRIFQQRTYDRLSFDRDYRSFFPLAVTRLERRGSIDSDDREGGGGATVQEQKVSISQINVGDRLVVRNGELIPADAQLISGPALVDYSFVTGESVPVDKIPGDHLYAGGRQMGAAIEMEMVKGVDQSYLTSLWDQDAFKKEKAESMDTLINRYSQWFTVIVIVIAALAAGWWLTQGALSTALIAFTSVLIVACPCALALVTPFTLGTALRILGRQNVCLKGAGVIERMSQIDTVVFDKTGTLTSSGSSSVRFAGEKLKETELGWLFSMTRHSIHPYAVQIGESISRTRQMFPDSVRSFLENPGKGMEGQVAGHEIWMGSAKWLADRNTRGCSASSKSAVNRSAGTDSVPAVSEVHVAIDGVYRGAFLIKGTLRSEAGAMLTNLAREHDLVLLSGDNSREEKQFAELLGGRAQLRFFQSPIDKLEFIADQQKAGRKVMMVGDGLNDAGALRQSDVGLAVIEATGAFSPASDGIIASDRVSQLDRIVRYSRSAMKVIKAGFAISAAYNIAGIAVATTGLLSPVFCAILMPISSITVVVFSTAAITWYSRRQLGSGASSDARVDPSINPLQEVPA